MASLLSPLSPLLARPDIVSGRFFTVIWVFYVSVCQARVFGKSSAEIRGCSCRASNSSHKEERTAVMSSGNQAGHRTSVNGSGMECNESNVLSNRPNGIPQYYHNIQKSPLLFFARSPSLYASWSFRVAISRMKAFSFWPGHREQRENGGPLGSVEDVTESPGDKQACL